MIKVQVLDEECTPIRQHYTDAGLDLKIAEAVEIEPGEFKKVSVGIKTAINPGYFGLIAPRSGLGIRGIVLKNTVGIIDSDYRGEVFVTLYNIGDKVFKAAKGTRVAQLLVLPCFFGDVQFVKEVPQTARGEKGFGSTGV